MPLQRAINTKRPARSKRSRSPKFRSGVGEVMQDRSSVVALTAFDLATFLPSSVLDRARQYRIADSESSTHALRASALRSLKEYDLIDDHFDPYSQEGFYLLRLRDISNRLASALMRLEVAYHAQLARLEEDRAAKVADILSKEQIRGLTKISGKIIVKAGLASLTIFIMTQYFVNLPFIANRGSEPTLISLATALIAGAVSHALHSRSMKKQLERASIGHDILVDDIEVAYASVVQDAELSALHRAQAAWQSIIQQELPESEEKVALTIRATHRRERALQRAGRSAAKREILTVVNEYLRGFNGRCVSIGVRCISFIRERKRGLTSRWAKNGKGGAI